ncbi:MAG: hypothetical protein AB7J32_17280 [Pseudonocardia sp.]
MTVHDLLLGLAGHVDDDLLDWSRELVATGEGGRAVEFVTAALVADGVALPPDVRAELVDAARTTRSVLDPDSALPPPSGKVGTPHRFEAPRAGAATARIAATVRTLLDGRGHAYLAARHTPAGGAPGPLPRAVVLVEVAEVVDVGGVAGGAPLAHRLGTALEEAGVPASVEVLTAGSPPSAYHTAALRAAWPLGDAGVAQEGPSETGTSGTGTSGTGTSGTGIVPDPAGPRPAADVRLPDSAGVPDEQPATDDRSDPPQPERPPGGTAADLPRRTAGAGALPQRDTRAASPGAADLFTPAGPDEPRRPGRTPLTGLTRLRITSPSVDGRDGAGGAGGTDGGSRPGESPFTGENADGPAPGDAAALDDGAVPDGGTVPEGGAVPGGGAVPEGGEPDDLRADEPRADEPQTDSDQRADDPVLGTPEDGDGAPPLPRLVPSGDPLPRRGSGVEGAHRLIEHEDDERPWWAPADRGATASGEPVRAHSLFATEDDPDTAVERTGPPPTRSWRGLFTPAAVIDGAVIDGAVIDGAVIDGAVIDGAVIEASVIDAGTGGSAPAAASGTAAAVHPGAEDAGLLGRPFAAASELDGDFEHTAVEHTAVEHSVARSGPDGERGGVPARPLIDPLNDPLPGVAGPEAERGAVPSDPSATGGDPLHASPAESRDAPRPPANLTPFPPRLGGPRRIGGRRRLREPAPGRDGPGTPPEVAAPDAHEAGRPSRHSLGPAPAPDGTPRPPAQVGHLATPDPPGHPQDDPAHPGRTGARPPQPLRDTAEIHPGALDLPARLRPGAPRPDTSTSGSNGGGPAAGDRPRPRPAPPHDTGRQPAAGPRPPLPASPQDRPRRPAPARLASVNGEPRRPAAAVNGSHPLAAVADGTGPRTRPSDGRPDAEQHQAPVQEGPAVPRPSPEPRNVRPRPSPHPSPGPSPAASGQAGAEPPQDPPPIDPRLGLSLEALERMSPTDRALLARLQSELGLRPPGRARPSPLPPQPLPTDPPDIAG